MNAELLADLEGIVSPNYVRAGRDARRVRENLVDTLLSQRRMPKRGWDEQTIEVLVQELAMLDSNNFVDQAGVGEREARIFSGLVARRHARLGHGIGRAGDLTAEQPKAAGSSILFKLTNYMALDALKIAGFSTASKCVVVPMATGLSVAVSLLSLKKLRLVAVD